MLEPTVEKVELFLVINHENWCEQTRNWLYAQTPTVSLGVDLRVEGATPEDSPAVDFIDMTELPAWSELGDFEINDSIATVEAWYRNDVPLTENRFQFPSDQEFRWKAQCQGQQFCCSGQLQRPQLTIVVKALPDLEDMLERAWPAQARRGVSIANSETMNYGPRFPETRRHWTRLVLDLL